MNPEPTPFDIVEVSRFAYVPGIAAWLSLLLLALLVIAAILYLRHQQKKLKPAPSPRRVFDQAFTTLRSSVTDDSTMNKEVAGRLSVLLRSYLATRHELAFESLSAAELSELQQKLSSKALCSLLSIISELDSVRFMPEAKFPPALPLFEKIATTLVAFDFEAETKA